MAWFVLTRDRRVAVIPGVPIRVGRDSTCDVVVEGSRISRDHLMVSVNDAQDTWSVQDRSSNGSFTTDGPIRDVSGNELMVLALGEAQGPVIVISEDPNINVDAVVAGFAAKGHEPSVAEDGSSGNLSMLPGVTRFGRAPDNDVVLQGVLASSHHAHVLQEDNTLQVIDLASARGTYINGKRITRATAHPGDRVSMGGSTFIVTDELLLHPTVEASGITLQASHISVSVSEATLLHDVSFTVPPRKVLAVVGPSGSGKSTLLGALTGFRPASSGLVLVDGRDLYQEYDEFRFRIGLVPQADLVPAQLRVRQALDYAARLRLPDDYDITDRAARIDQVMADLGLTERADLRIDRLSGGQRKRVSVALEMLTQPSLMFLDEPTSGLDPGLDRQVMVLLREMADQGQTVVVVTHAVENLGLADYLLVLAAGGHVAYYGPPALAPDYFGVPDMPSVFLALDSAPGTEWQRRWRDHEHRSTSARPPISTPTGTSTGAMRVSRPKGTWSQFWTMTSRNIQVIAADRTYATLLMVLPLVLAVTGFLVGNASGLGINDLLGFNPEARLLLLVLVLGSVFTGAATSIQELVKDRVIYQRERAVGLSRIAYLGSKALVLGTIAAIQGFVFATLALIGRPGPTDPLVLPGHLDITIMVAGATVASCMLGLVLSALIPTRDAALPALVIATMVQVVFSGAIPVRLPGLIDLVGWVMPGYWEFRAMAASVDLSQLLGPESTETTWVHTASQWWLSALVLTVMSAAFVAAAIAIVGRSDPGKR